MSDITVSGNDIEVSINTTENAISVPSSSAAITVSPTGTPGEKGDTGDTGAQGEQGIQGEKGDTGEGVPVGGTTGQVLEKIDGTDYNAQWADAYSLPIATDSILGGVKVGSRLSISEGVLSADEQNGVDEATVLGYIIALS